MPLIKPNQSNAAGLQGTLPNSVFPATFPAVSAENLTNIPADELVGVVDPSNLPAGSELAAGILQVGSNLSVAAGTVSLTGANVNAALGYTPVNPSAIGAANGVASLGADGKLPSSQVPAIAISDTFVVASEAAMLALTAQVGDVAVRSDLNQSYILKDADATLAASWQILLSPSSAVDSVNGEVGSVVLDAGDIDIAAITGVAATHVQGALAEHQADLDALDTRADALEAADVAMDARMDTAEADIDALEAADAALDSRVDALEADTGLADHLADAAGAHAASAVSVAAITGVTATDVQGALAEHQGDLNALGARVTTAEGDIDALEAADTALDGRLDTAEAALTSLDGRVDALEADSALADHVAETTGAHAASAISVGAITGVTATNVQAALAEHQGDLDALDARLDTAEADIAGKEDALGFTPENAANKGQANGYASLGADGKIPTAQIGSIAITDTFVVADQAAMLALVAEKGDVAVRTDLNKSFILKGTDPTLLADWQELLTPESTVQSVNGETGAITLDSADIGILAITGVTATTVQGALAEHQGDLEALDTRVDALEAADTALDARLDTAEADIAALEAADTAMDTRADALEAADVLLDSRLDTLEAGAGKSTTQAFAQLWAVGTLADFVGATVVDYYVNSGGAKTLGKIVMSSDLSGTTGDITIDILKKNTTGGSLDSLFTTVAKPTLTANGGLTWEIVTGAGLPDVVAIPDGAVLVLQLTGAPVDAENIKVELYEV